MDQNSQNVVWINNSRTLRVKNYRITRQLNYVLGLQTGLEKVFNSLQAGQNFASAG